MRSKENRGDLVTDSDLNCSEKQASPVGDTWGVLLAGILALVLLATVCIPSSELPHAIVCGFRRLANLPCPLCGLTRSFIAIGHGEWGEAWKHNPFGFPLYALASAWMIVLFCERYASHRVTRFFAELQLTRVTVVIGLALVVYGITRAAS